MSLFLVVVVAGAAAHAAYLWSRTRSLARAESDRAEVLVLDTALRHDDAPSLERTLHKKLLLRTQVIEANGRMAFVRVSLQDIRREIERMTLDVTWTMTAERREWKATRAIEEAMRKGTLDEARPDRDARAVATA
jgi:hypothetical protein